MGTNLDVTEQRRAEEELRRHRERLDLVVNSIDVGLWYCDLPFDRLVWNAKVKEHFGLPPDADVTIDTFYARLHPDDRERTRRAIDRSICEHAGYDIEYRTVGLDGRERWVRAIGRTFYSPSGEPVSFDGMTVDVTDRVRQQLALKEADRRKDEFLATLAHELRNPLAPIRNGLQVIRMAGANGTVERARSMMDRQLTQLVRLVDDLLDMSRVTSGKLELRRGRVELKAVIDAAVETSRPAIEQAGHDFAVVLPDEPIFVDGDHTRLAQVVSNLLNNSAKYTHPGGHIRLAVGREDQTAVVTVQDDGIGIPPAMLEKVFGMFAQVDRTLEKTTGGLGIGLSLVKGLVEMHGGTIEAKSDGEGRGSEFVVRLPVVTPAPGEADPPGRKDEDVMPSDLRRILVVDDNTDAADSLGQLLEMLGNEVRTAYDGEAGVAAARAFRPNVVLCDIGMPKVNGYDAARRIRAEGWGKNMVLVALTGWGQDDDRRKTAEAGFDHHLVKPVEAAALLKLLAGLNTVTA